MITLFEENEKEFTSLGMGVLKDAISCKVKEKLNDEFILSMEYPITGLNYDKLKINRLIYAKANPYDSAQPFRIISITKPIKGTVTVEAVHISYDANGIPVSAISGNNLSDVLLQIKTGCYIENSFEFYTDVNSAKSFKTTAPANLRAILMGSEDSVLESYDGEIKFDKFRTYIYSKRGKDRGAKVTYGKNMLDLNHTSNTDLLYNGVFPYYHSEKTSTNTEVEEGFKKVYIVGSKPYASNWLSYTKDGEPYIPFDESPIQIATEGEYMDKVYVWSEMYQMYQEKIYNEQVTIIQGVLEPDWIIIDWSKFPVIACKANRKGYFKTSSDTEWGQIRGVGDVIFEGSIVNSGIMENFMISYSEVIPTEKDTENKEVSEIIEVFLDDPIIWIDNNDARNMLHDNVLSLNLTSEFEEEPSKERLKAKAEEYITKNKIGTVKHETTVSFIDLSTTTDSNKYKNFDIIELGDTVEVVYEDLGVDVRLRVISTEYNVLTGRYDNIELGEKKDKLSDNTIQNGDGVSSLTNDMGYADVTTVNKLIAETVTANYIEAVNAKLSKAAISQLEVERIECKGIIEASQFVLDELVAKLLIADNAKISDTLEAGTIKVAGDVTVNSGKIAITGDDGTSFIVDREGNVKANSVSITGGTFNINDGMFEVLNDGTLFAQNADIKGVIRSTQGEIGGFTIEETNIHYGKEGTSNYVYLGNDKIELGTKFKVTNTGALTATDVDLTGKITAKTGSIANFTITSSRIYSDGASNFYSMPDSGIYLGNDGLALGKLFSVTKNGTLKASSVDITGKVTASSGAIANFIIETDNIHTGTYSSGWLTDGVYVGIDGIYLGKNRKFKVDNKGDLTANDATLNNVKINKGTISIEDKSGNKTFEVDSNGKVTATDITINGGEMHIGENFNVTNEGKLTAKDVNINGGSLNINGKFKVNSDGTLVATGVDLGGTITTNNITATGGTIGDFNITTNTLSYGTLAQDNSLYLIPKGSTTTTISGKTQTGWVITAGSTFGVDKTGGLYSTKGKIGCLEIYENYLRIPNPSVEYHDRVKISNIKDPFSYNTINWSDYGSIHDLLSNTNIISNSAYFGHLVLGAGVSDVITDIHHPERSIRNYDIIYTDTTGIKIINIGDIDSQPKQVGYIKFEEIKNIPIIDVGVASIVRSDSHHTNLKISCTTHSIITNSQGYGWGNLLYDDDIINVVATPIIKQTSGIPTQQVLTYVNWVGKRAYICVFGSVSSTIQVSITVTHY